jgi:hypothetical protein
MGAGEMSEEKKHFCPQCKEWHPLTHFNGLPLELRCNKCVPVEAAMLLYDEKVKLAGQKFAQTLDAAGTARSLKPLERMVQQTYDAWGGSAAFCEDVVSWIKDLASTGRGKNAAVQAAMKLLTLHAKVDRMRLEDDWKAMDDATLRETLKLKMLQLFAEAQAESTKKGFIEGVAGGND